MAPRTWTVFLDRDGVLNRKAPEGDYVKRPEEFRWLDGAPEAVRLLNAHDVLVVVVTNQRGVARGLVTPQALEAIHAVMREDLAGIGARLDAVYVCPHEAGTCLCRKPDVGLFRRARDDFPAIAFERSFVVGDTAADMEAGGALGCRTVLIVPGGRAPEWHPGAAAPSLLDAVRAQILPAVLGQSVRRPS